MTQADPSETGTIDVDGRSARWAEHRESRRVELVAAAVRAIDRHGPDVHVADIATEAGVSKPVLYRYFADKDELHAAVGRWAADEILDRVLPALLDDGPMRQRVTAAVHAYLRVIAEHDRVFSLLARRRPGGNPLGDGRDRIAATVASVLEGALRREGLDVAPAAVWAQSLVGIGMSTGEWWLERRSPALEEVAAQIADVTWHAISGSAAEAGLRLE